MKLKDAIVYVLDGYSAAMQEPFAGHPLAQFLRQDFPEAVKAVTDRAGDYLVVGSPGQGNWTRSPWVAIFDPDITDSAQRGYYPVYLFREDFRGVWLSLNQGVTHVRAQYGGKARDVLKARAEDFRVRLGDLPPTFGYLSIDLAPSPQSMLSVDYQAGNIIARYYMNGQIPENRVLEEDLLQLLTVYNQLSKSDPDHDSVAVEDDEQDNIYTTVEEDHSRIRAHKRVERNPKVSKAVKSAQGHVCKACGFDFRVTYPGVTQNEYVEAHHLIPISQLKGQKVSRDPVKDFVVLCANCHRMIHRCDSTSDIEAFKKLIKI